MTLGYDLARLARSAALKMSGGILFAMVQRRDALPGEVEIAMTAKKPAEGHQ